MEILRSIKKNIIDITNANNDIDADMLKKNIKSYFEKIADKENINNMKRDRYYEEYENKRVVQHINYDNYLREKAELMETFKNDKTKTALHNYLKLKPPKYDNLTLYSYLDVKIEQEKPVVKDDKPAAKKEVKPDVVKDDKPVAKQLDKCTPAKKAECEKKGKKCNPDSGRCVKADKPAAKVEDKPAAKVEDKPAAKEEDKPAAKVDKCTEAKKAECEKKGKKCNPDSGRCIKK